MDKSIFASKTFWGFGVALLIGGLNASGVMDASTITEVIKYAGGIVGVAGARMAIE